MALLAAGGRLIIEGNKPSRLIPTTIASKFYSNTFGEIYLSPLRFYEPIVKKNQEHLLEAPAIVLANLCVSCIMTSLVCLSSLFRGDLAAHPCRTLL